RTPKSLTLEIHHGGWFTPTPSRSYIDGHVSSVDVVDIDEFCLDYDLHSLNVDADLLEMSKYVMDYKIILVYVEHGSSNVDTSIFVTPKKGVAIAVDNHLRKAPIEIDSSPDVNRNLTPMCHRILKKEWEHVSSKSLSIGEVMINLTKKQPSSSVEAPIVVEYAEDPFEELDDILGEYANIRKQITGNEITGNEITGNEITRNESTGKQMVVHVGNNSTVDDVLELEMLFETEGVGPVGKFKEVKVDANNESEEESDTEGDYTMDIDSEDLDYDPKHDDVFDDDEHIVEEVRVNINNFRFITDPKHDTSIGGVDVQDDDLDFIDYDSFGSDLDDGIDSKRRMQLRELRRICKQKNKGPNKYYFYLGHQFASKEIVKRRVKKHSVETRRQLILVKNDNENDHVIKSLATNPNIPVRAVQDQIQKQFEAQLSGLMYNKNQIQSLLQELLEECPWPGQILTAVGIDANIGIYPVAHAIVEAESKASWQKGLIQAIASVFPSAKHRYCVRHIHENMKSQFKRDSIRTMKQSLFFRKLELTGIPCKHVVAAIYNMFKNSVGVGIHEQWVHAAYKLKTWAHVYSFKVNPCNRRDMWPVVESRTVIIPPLYKLPIGRPPNKRKKSNGEIASQSASSSKLSRKGKSVSCGKCGNVGHNRKDYRGQGGGSSQAGARKVFGQAAGATNVFGQAVGARKVSGQAAGATNVSGQAAGARMVSGQAAGAKKVSGQVVDARKASSQPNAVQSTIKQGPRQGFQGPIAGPASGSQRKTKKLMDL
ncbi:hypothetical protein Tco_1045554, partial [Tanacetum coccineum]